MKIALSLVVIGVVVGDARGEPYRPLPRLPPAKVRQRAATRSRYVPAPPIAAVQPESATADLPRSPPVADRPGPGQEARAAQPSLRRARRVGPPPPLQDELGRTIVFAAAPLAREGGGLADGFAPLHVIVLPSRGERAHGTAPAAGIRRTPSSRQRR
jgi:hypothetical protein